MCYDERDRPMKEGGRARRNTPTRRDFDDEDCLNKLGQIFGPDEEINYEICSGSRKRKNPNEEQLTAVKKKEGIM
jgi:hypothetical protein